MPTKKKTKTMSSKDMKKTRGGAVAAQDIKMMASASAAQKAPSIQDMDRSSVVANQAVLAEAARLKR